MGANNGVGVFLQRWEADDLREFDMVPRARVVKFIWIAGLSGFAFGVAGSLLGCLAAGWL